MGFNFVKGEQSVDFVDIVVNFVDIVMIFVDIIVNFVDIVANSFDIVLKSFSELNTDGFFALFMVLLDYILAFGCFSINFIGFSSILLFFHSISS
ncbi:hypothetical protein CN692_09710 [Bacillus sp. AFS002410]|nr:hypothetical protein CN692_09710 [Bacillus sp. AFS002410]